MSKCEIPGHVRTYGSGICIVCSDEGDDIPTMSDVVQDAAQTVYRIMGSGHSEAVYEASIDVELMLRNITRRRQVPCTLTYKLEVVGTGFIDILVDNSLIVEIKAIAKLTNKDEQQIRKYLKATGLDEGLLINFGNDLEFVQVKKSPGILIEVDFPVDPIELQGAWTKKGNHDKIG